MHRLLVVGLNHTTAPLAVRERLAFGAQERAGVLAAFRERFPQAEAVLLSTCNRVELYTARSVHGHPRVEEMIGFLAGLRDLVPEEIDPHLYRKADREAVAHLFSVACSLDSMVLGETQILGQVREAYDAATLADTTGALLHPLFQRAIAVGKQVMTDTVLSEGRLSVASVAVEYARRIFDRFDDKTVLSIGAGKMATLVLRNFQMLSPGKLLVCNRDYTKATALAAQFGGQAAPFERLSEHLASADIVISSTGAPHAIITRKQFEQVAKQRRYRPVFLIDIALPRDVESQVGDLENVYLYNIDDLQQVVAATQTQRSEAVAAAQQIVEQQVSEFAAWHRQREMGPLIDRLYHRYHEVAQGEISRTIHKLPNLTEGEKEILENLGRRIVNKLLHDPVEMLRSTATRSQSPAGQYAHALERLFKLMGQETDSPTDPTSSDQCQEDDGQQHGA
jgi:glutamyl-tRNA reductase